MRKSLQDIAAERLAAKEADQAEQWSAGLRAEAHDSYQRAWASLLKAASLSLADDKAGQILIAVATAIREMGHGERLHRHAESATGDDEYLTRLLCRAYDGESDARRLGSELNAARKWARDMYDAETRVFESITRDAASPPPEKTEVRQAASPTAAETRTPVASRKSVRLRANDAMILALEKNPEAANWTISEWCHHTGYGRTTISNCDQWKKLQAVHALAKAERILEREDQRRSNKRGKDGKQIDKNPAGD